MRFSPAATCLFLVFSCFPGWGHSQTAERECQCILNNLYLDVFLLVDTSSLMGDAGLFEVAANVNSVFGFSQIRVGDQYADKRGVRVAVVSYSSQALVTANLSDFHSTDELTKTIYALKSVDDDVSNLQQAMQTVQRMRQFTDQNAPRNNTKTVVIVYAADYQDSDQPTIGEIGTQLKNDGVVIVTMADINRNTHNQILKLAELASPNDAFNIDDDYPSEEVQKALCRANCFCPSLYTQYTTSHNGTYRQYGSCVRAEIETMSWTNAKFRCQNLHKLGYLATEYTAEKHIFNSNLFKTHSGASEPYKYHIGLHYVNGGYFWEQSTGLPLVALSSPYYPLDSKPASTLQCVSNDENTDSKEETWQNVNCFNEQRAFLCEVPACDTQNYCG